MTENKRYTWNSEDVVINDNVTGKQLEVVDITEIDVLLDLLNEQEEEIKKLHDINKGQELEIVRLHGLADAMSGVLRELGIYDVYDKDQIGNVKLTIERGEKFKDVF